MKRFLLAPSEFIFGLLTRFSSSHSPLCSSVKRVKILKNNSQKEAKIKSKQFLSTGQPPYNRFAGKGMDFTDCFSNINPESSVAGTAPDLWNYEKGDVAWNTANCFGGADKLSNWNQIHADWGGPNVDKASMKLTVMVKGDNLGFNIPFPTSGTTPAGITVDWGG